MNLNELKKFVDRAVETGHGDHEVVVLTQGLSCYSAPVKGIGVGFDWHNNQITISCKTHNASGYLADIDTREISKLQRKYLEKVSNINKVEWGGEKTAKYKKETKEFEKKFDAVLWIYEKLREDLKKN